MTLSLDTSSRRAALIRRAWAASRWWLESTPVGHVRKRRQLRARMRFYAEQRLALVKREAQFR